MKMKRDRAESGRFQCCYYLIWRRREAPSVGEIFPGARFTLLASYTDELNRGKSDIDIEEGYRYSSTHALVLGLSSVSKTKFCPI